MYLTLDVGGSKTRGRIYAENRVKEFEISGSFGRAEDSEEILPELSKDLLIALDGDCEKIATVRVNLGGKNKSQILRTVNSVLQKADVKVFRESEGTVALNIIRQFNANVIVMAGTGCIVLAKNGGKECVIGGWGKDIGDNGSGYNIGINAIKSALSELDGNEELSYLTKKITGVSGFDFDSIEKYCDQRDAVRKNLPKTRNEIAALTKTVVSCARENCPLSKRIISDNAKDIALLIDKAMQKVGLKEAKAVVNGGITNFSDLYAEELKGYLKDKVKDIVFINNGIDIALKNMCEE